MATEAPQGNCRSCSRTSRAIGRYRHEARERTPQEDPPASLVVLCGSASVDMAAVGRTLEARGWCVIDDALDGTSTHELRLDLLAQRSRGALQPAAVGLAGQRVVDTVVRGDHTIWLTEELGAPVRTLLQHFEALRVALNRVALLGLSEFEAHYSWYPPGAAYQRHLDRHRDSDARVVSAVLYLNDHWPDDAGGALRLFVAGDDSLDIAPLGGRLVLFLSAQHEHEVLPASRDRFSIAGWYRRPALATGRARATGS